LGGVGDPRLFVVKAQRRSARGPRIAMGKAIVVRQSGLPFSLVSVLVLQYRLIKYSKLYEIIEKKGEIQ
jgi:hypothetical protein